MTTFSIILSGALFAVVYTQTLGQAPSSCAATTCATGNTCVEAWNISLGIVQSQCLKPGDYQLTGHEKVCPSGSPLHVLTASGVREIFCGRGPTRLECPVGYSCNIHPTDAYAVCCGSLTASNKTGRCPETQAGEVGICAFTCQQDGQCQGGQKCCPTACGGTSCTAPTSITCDPNPCGAEQSCVMIQPQCFTTPCNPIYKCTDTPRDGVCPKPQFSWSDLYTRRACQKDCTKDSNCPGYKKCCKDYSGCGTACQLPQPSRTCANTECPGGTYCQMQQVQCVKAPCFDQPTCLDLGNRCKQKCGPGFECRLQRPWYCLQGCSPKPMCVRIKN